MIHEYFVLASFLSLGLIFLSLSLSLKYFQRIVRPEKPESFRWKIRFWRRVLSFLIILLIISRVLLLFAGPSELLNADNIANRYLDFFILTMIFMIFWVMILYFRKLEKYFKPDMAILFQKKVTLVILILVIIDLFFSGYVFLSGYARLFRPVPDMIHAYQFRSLASFLPFLAFVIASLVITLVFYFLFSTKRSMAFLNQYLSSFMVLMVLAVLFLFSGTAYVMGWQESLLLKTRFMSWRYGYTGMILAIFFAGSFFTWLVTVFILLLKKYFVEPGRIRIIVLPLLRFGLMSLIGFTMMVILPFLFNFWSF